MWVKLGNANPAETVTDHATGEKSRQSIELADGADHAESEFIFPPGHSLAEAFVNVTHPNGMWAAHSDDPAPTWVMSDVPELAALLSAQYGGIDVYEPGDGDAPDVEWPAEVIEAAQVSAAPAKKATKRSSRKGGR